MRKLARSEIGLTALIALSVGLIVVYPLGRLFRGWTIDAETTLRWRAFGDRRPLDQSATVVIALDEETYRTPPFKGSPTLTWTSDVGRVVGAALAAGAKAVGFDIVFASSMEESTIRFGDGDLGVRLRGFDRDFLRTLAAGAREGKIVLGEIATPDGTIRPSAGQRFAVGGDANIRALNVQPDVDGVVRRVPVAFAAGERFDPSFSLELAARALGERPKLVGAGVVDLGGWRVPSGGAGAIAIAFAGGPEEVPSYSLVDLRACLERGSADFFRRQFAGKVILVGLNTATEDQLFTAKRFLPTLSTYRADRCSPPPLIAPPRGGAISGVFLQAAAVENLIHRQALVEPALATNALLAVLTAFCFGFAALALRVTASAALACGAILLWLGAALLAIERFYVLPLFEPVSAGVFAALGGTLVRVVSVHREQRFLRRVFGLYLAPAMVERISASGALPSLGGETREVTLFFSDVVGFSTIAESLTPEALVALMNAYLGDMSEAIEGAGGFVDKFIGDAVVAIFGAPAASANHPVEAVVAALACRDRLAAFNLGRETPLRHRIGLNAGEALIGNLGSRNRFNYTALGDAVNLASRLEQVNTSYGTWILASDALASRTGDEFLWREIDTVRVRGRAEPVTIYEPLARRGEATANQLLQKDAYAEGLSAWRKRDFGYAEQCFAKFPDDRPAAMFRERCLRALADPLAGGWCPVFDVPTK